MTSWVRGRGLRVHAILTGILCAAALAFAAPNLFSTKEVSTWPGWLPSRQVLLGIEFVGGTSLLLEPDLKTAEAGIAKEIRDRVRQTLRTHRIRYEDLRYGAGAEVRFGTPEPEGTNRIKELLFDYAAGWFGTAAGSPRGITIRASPEGNVVVRLNELGRRQFREHVTEESIRRLHRRMRCLGIDDYRIVRERRAFRLTIRGFSEIAHFNSRCHHL